MTTRKSRFVADVVAKTITFCSLRGVCPPFAVTDGNGGAIIRWPLQLDADDIAELTGLDEELFGMSDDWIELHIPREVLDDFDNS